MITEKEAPAVPGNRATIYMEDILERFREGKWPAASHYVKRKREDPAFITYTSGSTGKPKGVLDTYAYIDNHNRARHHFYTPAPGECIGNIVSFSYAASTYDLFSGLTVGCNLYIFSDEELLNQTVTVSRVISHNITSMFMIPSMIPVIFAPGATALFTRDEEVIYYGTLFLRMNTYFLMFNAVNHVLAGALRGMGESKVPMYCMLACFVLIRQLYLFIGSRIAYNPYVVGFGYPVGWMACCSAAGAP